MAKFSKAAATQCDMSEGWSFPWAYLWQAEHGLLLIWLVGAALVLVLAARGWKPARDCGVYWLGAVVGMYLVMVILSVGLGRIGVWGRQSRQLVPFLCLATACSTTFLAERGWLTSKLRNIAACLVILQAGFNFAPVLAQRFPLDVRRQALATYGPVRYASTVDDGEVESNTGKHDSNFVLLNSRCVFYPVLGSLPAPAGKTLFRIKHPLQCPFYQYEIYTPKEREILRATDISIRLIDSHQTPTKD
jgi:hypothetical protein